MHDRRRSGAGARRQPGPGACVHRRGGARRRRRRQVPGAPRRGRELARGALACEIQLPGRDPLRLLEAHGVHRVAMGRPPATRRREGPEVPQLSVHSGMIYPGLAAATVGIDALEVHVTLSREMFGPDVKSSVTTTELRQLVDGIRFIERMKLSPVSKDEMAAELAPVRSMFSKS